jgi:hypothetical protein
MSKLKVAKIESPDTADGGITISSAGLVTVAAASGSISDISVAAGDTSKTLDFTTSNNFALTLANTSSCTIANPTGLAAGQTGSIFLVQDSTGSRVLAFGSSWEFAGGSAPTLTTTASAVDRIDFVVRTTTSIHAVFTANYS